MIKGINEQLSRMNIPESFIKQLELQKQQIKKIKDQQATISNIEENIKKKTLEIIRLRSLVDKYQPYYDKYNKLREEYANKCGRLTQKQKQVEILLNQNSQLLQNNQALQSKYSKCQTQRSQLLSEQHEIEKMNQQIEATFKLYQNQCKKKQMGLLGDLQKSYKQITQLTKRLDQSQMNLFQNDQLRKRIVQQRAYQQTNIRQSQQLQLKFEESRQRIQDSNDLAGRLKIRLEQAMNQLATKDDEVTKYKMLNNQLSLQFDKAVYQSLSFQNELSQYRKQNQELKKTLNIFIGKEHADKIQQKSKRQDSQEQSNQQESDKDKRNDTQTRQNR